MVDNPKRLEEGLKHAKSLVYNNPSYLQQDPKLLIKLETACKQFFGNQSLPSEHVDLVPSVSETSAPQSQLVKPDTSRTKSMDKCASEEAQKSKWCERKNWPTDQDLYLIINRTDLSNDDPHRKTVYKVDVLMDTWSEPLVDSAAVPYGIFKRCHKQAGGGCRYTDGEGPIVACADKNSTNCTVGPPMFYFRLDDAICVSSRMMRFVDRAWRWWPKSRTGGVLLVDARLVGSIELGRPQRPQGERQHYDTSYGTWNILHVDDIDNYDAISLDDMVGSVPITKRMTTKGNYRSGDPVSYPELSRATEKRQQYIPGRTRWHEWSKSKHEYEKNWSPIGAVRLSRQYLPTPWITMPVLGPNVSFQIGDRVVLRHDARALVDYWTTTANDSTFMDVTKANYDQHTAQKQVVPLWYKLKEGVIVSAQCMRYIERFVYYTGDWNPDTMRILIVQIQVHKGGYNEAIFNEYCLYRSGKDKKGTGMYNRWTTPEIDTDGLLKLDTYGGWDTSSLALNVPGNRHYEDLTNTDFVGSQGNYKYTTTKQDDRDNNTWTLGTVVDLDPEKQKPNPQRTHILDAEQQRV